MSGEKALKSVRSVALVAAGPSLLLLLVMNGTTHHLWCTHTHRCTRMLVPSTGPSLSLTSPTPSCTTPAVSVSRKWSSGCQRTRYSVVGVPEEGSRPTWLTSLAASQVLYGILRMGFGAGKWRRTKRLFVHWSG